MLNDMMASLFGGNAPGGAAGQKKETQQIKGVGAPPKPISAPAAASGSGSAQAPAAAVADDLVDDEMD